ncbi:sensor histidine kinase [Streptomyces sp. NPDC059742]|uniref:sensor histidine kinase n=1 Tax=Streptomyces sp. NPDC059742 TaxID=3346927 RepID=UPI00366475FB
MCRIHRTRRDWAADRVAGGLGCAAVLLRRRAPIQWAVVLLLAGSVAHYLTGPAMVAVFTVAATRSWEATAWVAALVFGPLPPFLWQLPDMSEERAGSAVTYFALIAGAIGWGLFRRSRQQLIASLRERAELAEADAESRAERARMEAGDEIAREMHDVLGHRLSLLSVHAGALEFNPGAPRAEIERAAGVMRESAHLALHDLREVIGVLRAEPGTGPAEGGERPRPELADLPRLVAEARAAGGRIELAGPPEGAAPPPRGGGCADREVQGARSNVRPRPAGGPRPPAGGGASGVGVGAGGAPHAPPPRARCGSRRAGHQEPGRRADGGGPQRSAARTGRRRRAGIDRAG